MEATVSRRPSSNRHINFPGWVAIYFLRAVRAFGAACDNALPAAVFDGLLVRPSRKTFEAAFAARGLVFRLPGIAYTPFQSVNAAR